MKTNWSRQQNKIILQNQGLFHAAGVPFTKSCSQINGTVLKKEFILFNNLTIGAAVNFLSGNENVYVYMRDI